MCCMHAVPAGWVISHHPLCLSVIQFLDCGSIASSVCVCAAMKKKIMIVEITKLKAHYAKIEVQ